MCKEAEAREKPKKPGRHSRSGRKRGLKHYSCDLAVDCQMNCDSGTQGLAERNDRFAVDTLRVHKVFVSRIRITVDAGLAWLSFAVAVTAIFQGKDVCMGTAEKFIHGRAVCDVGGVAVKGEIGKSRLVVRYPPRVEPDAVGGRGAKIFNIQSARMPVAFETVRIIREENQVRLEHADEQQNHEIRDKDREKVAQETTVKGLSRSIRRFHLG